MKYKFLVMYFDHVQGLWSKENIYHTHFANDEEAEQYAFSNKIKYIGCEEIESYNETETVSYSVENSNEGHQRPQIKVQL